MSEASSIRGSNQWALAFYICCGFLVLSVPSVLWRCWLGGRKGIRPVKNWVVGCWRGYLSGARADLHMAQLMPLPLTVSCFSNIQTGFTCLVPALLEKGPLNGCMYVCMLLVLSLLSAERNASELVTRLLEMSEKARKTEELLERMEKERYGLLIVLYILFYFR